MLQTPILFLIFNRPDTTAVLFEKIKAQKPKYLYIAADGARENKEGEAEKCEQVRKIATAVDWDCEVKTLFREENLGCKKAVSSAISWFFENVEEGIILEDDCVPSDCFFNYCEALLEKYRHDTRIMHISGENPLDESFGEESYYFSKIPHIWGWASWRRAWKTYDPEFQNFDDFLINNSIKNVFPEKYIQKYWNKIFLRVQDGRINTWDYQWTYNLFVNNGLSINPNKNMVSNIGFGVEGATHTAVSESCANRQTFEIAELQHPQLIMPNLEALYKILKVRYDLSPKTPASIFLREISRVVRKSLKK